MRRAVFTAMLRFAMFASCLFAFPSLDTSAVELESAIADYANRSRWERVRQLYNAGILISQDEAKLLLARKGRVDRNATQTYSAGKGMIYPSAEAKKKDIQDKQANLANRKKWVEDATPVESRYFSRMPHGKPRVGKIANFDDQKVGVFQGLSDDSALVNLAYGVFYQEQNPNTRQISWLYGTRDELVLLKSKTVEGAADGSHISINGLHWFSGSDRYETETGTNTVLILEPVEMPEHHLHLFTREGEMREWTDSKGKSLGHALVDACDDKVLMLRFEDNRTARIRRNTVSDECENYLEEWFTHLVDPNKPKRP